MAEKHFKYVILGGGVAAVSLFLSFLLPVFPIGFISLDFLAVVSSDRSFLVEFIVWVDFDLLLLI